LRSGRKRSNAIGGSVAIDAAVELFRLVHGNNSATTSLSLQLKKKKEQAIACR